MMVKQVAIVLLSIVAVGSAANEVKHLQLNEANLIETSASNFALNTPLLQQNGWKTVSVNGNNVLVVSPQCQQTIKSTDSLSQQERAALVNARQQLGQVELGTYNMNLDGQQVYRSASTTFSLYGQSQSSSYGRNINLSTFNNNGASITKYADDRLTVSRPDLPNNLARLFMDSEVATFVYRDGQVMMKPINCLQPDELKLLQQVKQEALLAEQHFQASMQQFNQNMADWQSNFQQSMQNMNANLNHNLQNMNHNLNGMFANQRHYQPADSYPYQQRQQQQQVMGDDYNYNNGYNNGNYLAQQQSGNFPFGPNNSPFCPGFPFCQ